MNASTHKYKTEVCEISGKNELALGKANTAMKAENMFSLAILTSIIHKCPVLYMCNLARQIRTSRRLQNVN